VWVGIEDPEIVFASLGPRRKLDNIRADPRVALSIEGDAHNQLGLRDYLVVHGTARITEGGGPELLQRLAHTYLGPTCTSRRWTTRRRASSCASPWSAWAASALGPDPARRRRLAGRPQPLAGDAHAACGRSG
jgi:hypothetical protein